MAIQKADNVAKNLSTSKVKPANPQPKAEVKPAAETKPTVKSDTTGLSAEAKTKEKSNAGPLGALADTFGTKKGETEGGKPTDKPNAPKSPDELKKQIDSLQDQLKEARARGDKDAVARLEKELKELQGQAPGAQPGNPGAAETPGAAGAPAAGGAAPAAGGGAPAGGGGAPAGGGGAPAGGGAPEGGGAPAGGGGAPAGGGAPGAAGGANEAGAGQGAGAGKEEVDQFIQFAAQAYGADPKVLSEIARRESNFNTGDIANNWDSNARKGTPSKGMFQFIEPTFKSMMPQAKAANPQAWQGISESWTDWKAQALTTAWAITNGKGSHWATYQAAVNTARGGGGGTANA